MNISEVMNPECTYCDAQESINSAARLMQERNIGFLPVAENEKLVGALTDRDIVTRGVAPSLDLVSTTAKELMTNKVYYCYADEDCEAVAENMADTQVRRLPVVDRNKNLIGMVSLGDLTKTDNGENAAVALTGIVRPSERSSN